MKRLDNYQKIKDFLERAQNQELQNSRPIYMSKEHGKLLMQKAKKFKADVLKSHGISSLINNAANTSFVYADNFSDNGSLQAKRHRHQNSAGSSAHNRSFSSNDPSQRKNLQKRIFSSALRTTGNKVPGIKSMNELLTMKQQARDKKLKVEQSVFRNKILKQAEFEKKRSEEKKRQEARMAKKKEVAEEHGWVLEEKRQKVEERAKKVAENVFLLEAQRKKKERLLEEDF